MGMKASRKILCFAAAAVLSVCVSGFATAVGDETMSEPATTQVQVTEPVTEPVKAGFVQEGDALYYYKDGVKFVPVKSGVYSFDGKAYLFTADGATVKYAGKSVAELAGEKYFITEDNSLASGLHKIDGKTYYFEETAYAMKKGWVTFSEGKKDISALTVPC